MIRNPLLGSNNNPQLNEEEEILVSCDLCKIEFGELNGNGSFCVTTQRILWIKNNDNDNDNNTCYSFSCLLTQLMVHALCKETDPQYLFLQIENQDDEIRIINESYELLQNIYDALCKGQKLNPCEGDSEDGGNALMSFENQNDPQTMQQLSEIWDNKLQLNTKENMVNNNGYLESAAVGQFDDVDKDANGNKMSGNTANDKDLDSIQNPYLDQEIINDLSKFAPEYNKKFEEKFKTHHGAQNKDTAQDKQ